MKPKKFAYALVSIVILIFCTYVDKIVNGITFIGLYIMMVYLVSTYIGGNYSYIFSIAIALSQFYTEPIPEQLTDSLWFMVNLIGGYMFIAHVVIHKNIVLEALEQTCGKDPLTKLPNRLSFNDYLDRSLAHSRRWKEHIAIAYIDVDHFKRLNDQHGHHAGDELLKCIGAHISEELRADDMGARLGGDEFAIILKHTNDHSHIYRIKEALDKCKGSYDISYSIGMILYDGTYETSTSDILRAADELMYEVKKSSKDAIKMKFYEGNH